MNLRTLGRSGLIVSPFSLGTMTFGNPRWGSSESDSKAILNAYLEGGGNFLDTADVYVKGESESLLGRFIADAHLRDRVVLASKCTFSTDPTNPLSGGNGRKHIHQSLDASLKRLRTDYLDLYWMHAWDTITPAEEVLETLVSLTRAGKILHYGLSDCPAWYAARLSALAEARGLPGPIALQMEYSLVERSIENEYIAAARASGLGLTPWSPLGAGFLTGKYKKDEKGGGRLDLNLPNFQKFTDSNWKTLEAVQQIATDTGRSLAEVSLAWLFTRPGVTSVIIGATSVQQLQQNFASQTLSLTPTQLDILNAASAPAPGIYRFFQNNAIFFAGQNVTRTL